MGKIGNLSARDLAELAKTPEGKLRKALARNKKGNKKKVTLAPTPWDKEK
jgi:hypothetical protein